MAKAVKYLEGLTIHKVPYNIANTDSFRDNVMADAADNELFIITDTPTFSLKIGNVTYDGTSNVSAIDATESASGLMSAADKIKLNGIAKGATKIKVDTALSSTSTNPVQNKVIKTELDKKAGTAVATTSANGLMSVADKTKLNGIAKEANKTIVDTTLSDSSTNPVQNKVVKAALDNKADKTALDAKADKTALDGKLDKTGGTLTGNLTGKYFTGTWLQTTEATDFGRVPGKIAVLDESGWVYYRTPAEIKSDIGADAVVTTSSDGLMSVADKKKLDGIDTGANKITVDTSLSSTSTNPVQNKVVNSALSSKAGTSIATTSANGLMSSADKKKLDGIAIGATKITVDTALSSTSTNPVQNKVINSALSGKAGTSVATTSANGLMSAADKTKLNGIATGATKITVDTALSDTSTNPVQNKVIKTELDKKADNTALDNKLDKTGGTLTGNLTGQYITGTWLQTTEATDFGRTPGKIAVLDESGWVYYRTPAEIKTDIGIGTQTIIDTIYPYGSIYITLNQTSPSKLFPGTYWKQIKNRFLLSASSTYSASSVGGEATHALTTDEMPNHQHSIWFPNSSGEQSAKIGYPEAGSRNTYYAEASKTSGTGGGAAHNNMPPYLAVYMWERVHKDQVSGYNEDVYFIYGL